MTFFQLAALGFFGVAVAANYRVQIGDAVRTLWRRIPATATTTNKTNKTLVQDLMTIDDLRDRLAAMNCKEGVDACTILLRVMIEFDYQAQK